MNRFALILFAVALPQLLSATTPSDRVEADSFDADYLSRLVFEKINQIRLKKGLPSLTAHEALGRAAQYHANYLEANKVLTHFETSLRMKNPSRRAEHFGFMGSAVGENALQSYVSFRHEGFSEGQTYEQVAKDFVDLWVHSRGHYENLLDPDYRYTGVGVAIDKRSGEVYAVQVFGG